MLAFLFQVCGVETPKSGQPLKHIPDFGPKYDEFMKSRLENVVGLSGRDAFVIVHGDLSMSEAVESYFKKGVHRVAICDDNGDVIGVISQWTIINYLATVPTEDKEWIPSLKTRVGDYPFKTSRVLAVDMNTSALDAFLHMHANGLSAVGVVDFATGKLCGNLSASDLKGWHLFERDLRDLNMRVCDFLAVIRKFQGRPCDFVVTVSNDTLIEEAINRLNKEFVKRACIIDQNRLPLGILSLTDIMKGIVVDTHELPTYAHPVTATGEVRTKPMEYAETIPSPRSSV